MGAMKKAMMSTGSNLVLMLVKAATTFILTPITLRALGRYDYGIWEMVTAVVGYMGVLELGLKPAVSRYTARFNAQADDVQLRAMYSTALLMLGIVGGFALIFFSAWALFRPDLVAPDGASTERYSIFLVLIGLQLLITFPGHVAESVLEGLQQYSTKNNITIVNSLTGLAAVYFLIEHFDALIFLALINGVGTTTKYIVFFRLVYKRTNGRLFPTLRYRSKAFFNELVRFSSKSFVQGASTSLEGYAPVLIIGSVLGPAQVVFYSLPLALIRQVRNLTWTLTHAFMPLFSELHAKEQSEAAKHIFLLASRFVVGLVVPIAALIILLGPDFLGRWAGQEYVSGAASVVGLLAAANLLGFANPFASRYLTAIGQHGILAKIGPFSAASSIALGLLLVGPMGLYGPPTGQVAVACVVVPLTLYVTCKLVGITLLQYTSAVLVRFIAPAVLLVVTVLALEDILPPTTYPKLAIVSAAGALVYFISAPFLAMTSAERKEIVSWIRRRGRSAKPAADSPAA